MYCTRSGWPKGMKLTLFIATCVVLCFTFVARPVFFSWAAVFQETLAPPWSFPRAAGESMLRCLEHLLLSPWCCRAVPHTFPLTPRQRFALFLHRLSPRCHHGGWRAQPCTVVGGLEPLEPSVSDTRQPWPLCTWRPLQLPAVTGNQYTPKNLV